MADVDAALDDFYSEITEPGASEVHEDGQQQEQEQGDDAATGAPSGIRDPHRLVACTT